MTLLNIKHDDDPAEALFKRLQHVMPRIQIGNDRVLVAVYVRPTEMTLAGGQKLFTAPATQKEDELQGKAALVLKCGPCVNPDGIERTRGFRIDEGDWIAVNASDGWSLNMGSISDKILLRLLSEKSIHVVLDSPDLIW